MLNGPVGNTVITATGPCFNFSTKAGSRPSCGDAARGIMRCRSAHATSSTMGLMARTLSAASPTDGSEDGMAEAATLEVKLAGGGRVLGDLVVMKALSHDEESPRHWHDALGVLAKVDLDWDYLLERASLGPNRVLALLHYALSVDVPVPASAINHLHELVSANWVEPTS